MFSIVFAESEWLDCELYERIDTLWRDTVAKSRSLPVQYILTTSPIS